jgi:hypothetical protein
MNISGRVAMGSSSAVDSLSVNESLQISDNLSWSRRSHTIKAGASLLKLRVLNRSYFLAPGDFTFTGDISGNAASDYFLGRPAAMTVASPILEQGGLQTNGYFYIQDDWRIHPNFTLNLGLRYELSLPWVHPNDFWGTLRFGQQSTVIPNAPLSMVYAGDAGIPRGMVDTDKNNFAPRIGFAWDLFGKGRTSLRGAYGIFYETINCDIVQNTSQPFQYTFNVNVPASLSDPLRGQAPLPLVVDLTRPTFSGVQQLFIADPTLRSPYVQNLSLNIQHQVTRDLAVQVGYSGKLGRKLLMGLPLNPAVFGPGATLANIDQRRIYQPFGNLNKISSQANSSYHALQVEVTKRFSNGFSLQGAYAFGRSIDQASAIALGGAVPDVSNLRTQRGLSDYFAKHIASFSWLWEVPGPSGNGFLRAIAGDWQINGLVSVRTGLPINMLAGADVALSGTPNQRPSVIGDPVLSSDRPRGERILNWFDRTAFISPAAGTYGNVGRNALIGPNFAAANTAIFKNFRLPLREDMRLQFRSEFFNVLNSVNLGNPNTNIRSGVNTARITSAGEARVIQFALKLIF